MLNPFNIWKSYNCKDKPKTYPYQATVEYVNNGGIYYIGSKEFGYEGKHVPVKGSVSNHAWICQKTGSINYSERLSKSLWVTCTESRYQFDDKYKRCSLKDDGVEYQVGSDRMAFTTQEAARYYSKTGKFLKEEKMTKNDLQNGMVVQFEDGCIGYVIGDAICGEHGGTHLSDFNNDFTSRNISNRIIKTIYDVPNSAGYSILNLLDKIQTNPKDFTILWERKEVEEMTLEQICKELGKEIKIIK